MLKGQGGEYAFVDRELPEDLCDSSLYYSNRLAASRPHHHRRQTAEVSEQDDPPDGFTPRALRASGSTISDDDSFSDIIVERELARNYVSVPQHLFEDPVSPKTKPKSKSTTGLSKKDSPNARRRGKSGSNKRSKDKSSEDKGKEAGSSGKKSKKTKKHKEAKKEKSNKKSEERHLPRDTSVMTLATAIAAANGNYSDSTSSVSSECSSSSTIKKSQEAYRIEKKQRKKEEMERALERKEREKREKELRKQEKSQKKEKESTKSGERRTSSSRLEKSDRGSGGMKSDLLRETLVASKSQRDSLNEYLDPKISDAPSRSSYRSSTSEGSELEDSRASPSLVRFTEKGSAEIKIIHVKTLELCASLKSLILQVCKHQQRQSVLSKDDIDRLKYLYETVHLINFYVSSQTQENRKIKAYNQLLFPLHDALLQTHKMVTDISRGTAAVTENFDVFELTLRRYLEQSNRLFPLEGDDHDRPDPPSSCIEDKKARQVWERTIGADEYFTTFSNFLKRVVEPEFPEARDETFQEYLSYFLNFPADDVLTVYKWNLLLRLFGPYDQFTQNFRTLVLERGFLGLINRIKAQEILLLESSPSRLLLIRQSRTEPEFLAFSYKDEHGNIRHSLNKEENDSKTPVPVSEYLRRKFPRFALVGQRVNVRSLPGNDRPWSLADYARQASSNAYILPSLPNDDPDTDGSRPAQSSPKVKEIKRS